MVGWHHCISGHESEQNLGDSEGQKCQYNRLRFLLQSQCNRNVVIIKEFKIIMINKLKDLNIEVDNTQKYKMETGRQKF